MSNETTKAKIKEVLNSEEKLAQWASWNGLVVEAARTILTKLAEQPQVSEEAKKFIWEQASSDTKSYIAGEEKGFQRGHWCGWGKGLALGVVGCVGIGIALIIKGATNGVIDLTKLKK